ncbi:hypothetical protein ACQUSY_12030 [Microbacterium sp. YY-03]|uniref:hypothetical protein n=1 Tax=Microbacterium sp. YY-03 TaxID=3421636 RepID=UPI003D16A58B
MSELAEAGLVADPVALRAAVPDAIVQDSHDPIVLLPSYEALQMDRDVSDAERAELMSALTSEMVGVGTSFDSDAFLARLNAYGPCAGAVIPK